MARKHKMKRLQHNGHGIVKNSLSSLKSKQFRKSCGTALMQFTVTPLETSSPNLIKAEKFAINPDVCLKAKDLRKSWKNGKRILGDILEFDSVPFKHCVIKRLLKDNSFLNKLSSDLAELPYELMSNDLYSFKQTNSLFGLSESFPSLKNILEFIKGPLRALVGDVTGKDFTDKVTATASQYEFTDRLLCHDDNLEDRSVAFIFYLCKDWNEQNGGSLDLYSCNSEKQPLSVVKSIIPSFGSFAFFEVSHHSYHQVAEVVNSKSVRLSINGWYHGKVLPVQDQWFGTPPKMYLPIQPRGCSQDDWVNPSWLSSDTLGNVKMCFQKELSIALPKFLKSSVYKEILTGFREGDILWKPTGPANRKRYEVAKVSTLPAIIKEYVQFIQSKQWFRLLSQYTVDIDPDITPKPKCWFEVQRWKAGDYTMLVDNDPLNNSTGMDVHLYFGVAKRRKLDRGGNVHYLGPDRDESGCLESAAQLEPESNTATIIAHIEGMATLTKYLDHRNKPFFKIFARYSQSFD